LLRRALVPALGERRDAQVNQSRRLGGYVAPSMYKSGTNGYEVVKITVNTYCGWPIEAGITCNGGKDGAANIWGAEISAAGGSSFASCNTNYPAFDGNGGYRIWFNGAWEYHTEIYT
jgi:hypothetical protein